MLRRYIGCCWVVVMGLAVSYNGIARELPSHGQSVAPIVAHEEVEIGNQLSEKARALLQFEQRLREAGADAAKVQSLVLSQFRGAKIHQLSTMSPKDFGQAGTNVPAGAWYRRSFCRYTGDRADIG